MLVIVRLTVFERVELRLCVGDEDKLCDLVTDVVADAVTVRVRVDVGGSDRVCDAVELTDFVRDVL